MSIIKRIVTKLYVSSYILSRLALKEYRSETALPFAVRFLMWRLGFFSSSYILYNLKDNPYREYLNDYRENVKAIRVNHGYQHYLDNKILFSALVQNDVEVPPVYALIMNGVIQPLTKAYDVKTAADILSLVKKESIILKPVDSASGAGVVKLEYKENVFIKNNAKETEEDLIKYLKSLHNYIISPSIGQAKYSKDIYPRSVNTVRILTMVDPALNTPFIAAAAHRFGTDISFPVDNCNAGGLTAEINIETGELSSAVRTKIRGNALQWFDKHPDTGAQIKGLAVPQWRTVRDKILELSGRISFLKYIGWDIIIMENGFIVLEGNDGPDVKLHQVHRPLLADENVRKFYKHYNVI
jgi:hypothetical protein